MKLKQQLRKQLRIKRNSLQAKQQILNAQKIANLFSTLDLWNDIHYVAVYHAIDGEISTNNIVKKLWQAKKYVYLPVIANNCLSFHLWQQHIPLKASQYGIMIPDDSVSITIKQLDLILLPLTGFDKHGNRLGMGKGYYDRTLQTAKPLLIGLAHAIQYVPQGIPTTSTDVKLDAILTENGFQYFKGNYD